MVCRTWGLGGRLCWDSFFSVWLKMYLVTPEIRLQAPENNSFCTSRVWAAAAGSACSFCRCVPALTRTGHLLRSASNSLSTLIHFLALSHYVEFVGSALWILPGKWMGRKTSHHWSDWDWKGDYVMSSQNCIKFPFCWVKTEKNNLYNSRVLNCQSKV